MASVAVAADDTSFVRPLFRKQESSPLHQKMQQRQREVTR